MTLPADPRIASATARMRQLLEERKKAAGQMCELEEQRARQKVYDCECYMDRVVIETLDENSTIVNGGRDRDGNIFQALSPVIELVAPRADMHACMDQTILPAPAHSKGMEMADPWQGEARNRLAQCVAGGTGFLRCGFAIPRTP